MAAGGARGGGLVGGERLAVGAASNNSTECNEEFALFEIISERVVDTSRHLLKCVGGVGAGCVGVHLFPSTQL